MIRSVFVFSVFVSSLSFASLDSQFSQCAATALQAKSLGAEKISVELPVKSFQSMNHDPSSRSKKLKMELVDANSGEPLGSISCRVTRKGVIKSVRYLSQHN